MCDQGCLNFAICIIFNYNSTAMIYIGLMTADMSLCCFQGILFLSARYAAILINL